MNFLKIILSITLISIPASIYADLTTIECSDRFLQYDSNELKDLVSETIQKYLNDSSIINKSDLIISFPTLDSKSFKFLLKLAKKNDTTLFTFIDSLNKESFQILAVYAKTIKESRISKLLAYKALKNPDFTYDSSSKTMRSSLFLETIKDEMKMQSEASIQKFINLLEKHNLGSSCTPSALIKSFTLAILIYFYLDIMQCPLPLDTDHLKELFFEQPVDVQQFLCDEKFVTIPKWS